MKNYGNYTCLDDFVAKSAPICYGILKPGEHFSGGIPVIKVKNIRHGSIETSGLLCTTLEINSQYKRSIVQAGDILLTIRGTTGRLAIVPNALSGANITQDTARIRVSTEDSIDYLFYALQSEFVQAQIDLNTVGQAVKGINISEVRKINIFHPSKFVQRKIASILTTWDDAINTTEQLLTNSQQRKKALMQQLLTGKVRFAEFDGEWNNISISKIGQVVTGNTPPKNNPNNYGGEISWATANDFNGKYVKNTSIKISELGARIARVVPKNSILVTCIASIGKNAVAAENMATNQQINSVIVNSEHNNEYFYYTIENNIHKLKELAGTTAVPIVNKSTFEKIVFSMPSLLEQQKIVTVLATADEEIDNINAQLDRLQLEKKALMQQLLTGKVRVKVEEAA